MALEFVDDAICLSGLTGSKLKSDIIGEYYPFWWGITSGGPSKNYQYATAIVELDAGTGEIYIKDTREVILGSAGHALELKFSNPNTNSLKVILVEKDVNCYEHLKKVIQRRWVRSLDVSALEGVRPNRFNIYLLNQTLDNALASLDKMTLRNTLFFFDPLRNTEYSIIENVARKRVSTFYRTGTEFILFLFTSDWFLGREPLAPLPVTDNYQRWTLEEKQTVLEADGLFGDQLWRPRILNNQPAAVREKQFIELYKYRLHKWFRYVLPLPFNPKENQIFHLILCSNYSVGVKATKNFFIGKTKNPKYTPDNRQAYTKFKEFHPDVMAGFSGSRRPPEWKILWKAIVEHEEGICDYTCSDLIEIEADAQNRQKLLEWLENAGYLIKSAIPNGWNLQIKQYKVNWEMVRDALGIELPQPLQPLSPKEIV
jgi:three-Cys-motif partner protein